MLARRHVGIFFAALVLAGCAGTTIKSIADPIFIGDSGECRTRLRGVQSAMLLYGGDYDDQFPLANWSDTIDPYLTAHPEFMSCPGLHSADQSQSGYALNQDLVGANFQAFPDRSSVVMFYETALTVPGTTGDPEDHLTTSRHGGSIFRIYWDGFLENVGE
jgi:hypothetical protein